MADDLSPRPRIALFTLTRNRLDYTKLMMDSLAAHTKTLYDHFIVDNGSTDGTVEYLRQKPGRIKAVIYNQENKGISMASNQALEAIGEDYDYICKIDNDCLVHSDNWLATIAALVEANPTLVLSPRVDGLHMNKGGAPRHGQRSVSGLTLGLTKHLGGICVFSSSSTYRDYRFDENDTFHGGQDSHYSRHLVRTGYHLAYVEELAVEHMDGSRGQAEKYPDYYREYFEKWRWHSYGRRRRPIDILKSMIRRRRVRKALVARYPPYLQTLTHAKRVAFLPGVIENPYLPLLARELSKSKLGVAFDGRLAPLWLWRNRRFCGVLHLHWLEFLHGRRDGLRGVADYLYFVVKLRLARLIGYRTVWTVHNLRPHAGRDGFAGRHCRRYVARRADAIICHSQFVRDELKTEYGRVDGVTVIPHGNYTEWEPYMGSSASSAEARQALGLPSDKFIYLFFGQIRANKGLEKLIAAVDGVDKDAALVIAGKPMADASDIQGMVDPKIHPFLEFIPDERVHLFFAAADALVLPFSNITTSGSLMLGLSFGKPVVIPAFEPLLETVTPEFAVTYDPDDETGLAEALRRMRALDVVEAGAKAREVALALDWESIGKRHSRIYLDLVRPGKGSS